MFGNRANVACKGWAPPGAIALRQQETTSRMTKRQRDIYFHSERFLWQITMINIHTQDFFREGILEIHLTHCHFLHSDLAKFFFFFFYLCQSCNKKIKGKGGGEVQQSMKSNTCTCVTEKIKLDHEHTTKKWGQVKAQRAHRCMCQQYHMKEDV